MTGADFPTQATSLDTAAEGRPATRTGAGDSDRTGRRKACNQCKQQKLRCDLPSANEDGCARCRRLALQCRVDSGFQRVRKRRRSFELANEVRSLRQQLHTRSETTSSTQALDWALTGDGDGLPAYSPRHGPQINPTPAVSSRNTATSVSATTNASPSASTGPSPNSNEHSRAPGVTTRPVVDDQPEHRREPTALIVPRPRALGNTALSVDEIDELFMIYVVNYHPFLPLIDPSKSPHEVYSTSELLFWSIISVAARRLQSQPTLLRKLARSVTDLLWRSLRSIPYSLTTVQALALICTWPFPTSSSTADPTFMLVGIMLQLGVQMGLHRALHVQDFVKTPVRLSADEYAEWVRTWHSCNIVAQSVSVGCGLPVMIQMHDWSLTTVPESASSSAVDVSLRLHLRIEQFRHRVSQVLGSTSPSSSATSSRERLSLYQLLNTSLNELERDISGSPAIINWYLSAARLHLHAFYLFDDASTDGYNDRIITLYQTAYSLIELSQELNAQESPFFDHCPFFCHQVFVCAAFVLLKILNNGFFRLLLDADSGKKLLDSSIVSLRRISVVNNDLPARLGDVIAFFCTLEDPTVIGGATGDELRLREVKNRLSMSVVYDSLWIWRKHFQDVDGTGDERPSHPEDEYPILRVMSKLLIDSTDSI